MARSKDSNRNEKPREDVSHLSVPEEQARSYDPALTSLFASSLGPVIPVLKSGPAVEPSAQSRSRKSSSPFDDAYSDGLKAPSQPQDSTHEAAANSVYKANSNSIKTAVNGRGRKRKWKDAEDDLEERYMQQLAREEAKDEERYASRRSKRQKVTSTVTEEGEDSISDEEGSDLENIEIVVGNDRLHDAKDVPQHETQISSKEAIDLKKASRTVFLANVSTMAIKSKTAKKALIDHLTSFFSSLSEQTVKHRIESVRFRSTAFASSGIPKKAAFVKKELMDTTTKSTNAYAVYSTQVAAREAAKRLNGTVVLGRHLRVDSTAHPAKQDHRRCVFVGNLGFVDDESATNEAEGKENNQRPRKVKEPADVEEGLWRQFSKAGGLESVRVVRDKTTRVGKGFAYVQFEDANAVERALLFNEKKYPPMLPRILRVTRAKSLPKPILRKERGKPDQDSASRRNYKPKLSSQVRSLSGRASKMLGRAGAAQLVGGIAKTPEAIVFEGYRASAKQGKGGLKIGGSGKKHGKPRTRSSKRGAEFKAKSRRKAKP